MNSSESLISRTSIVILSYYLVQLGIALRSNPPVALNCVLVGTIGFISYVALQRAAFLRSRETAWKILASWGHSPH